MLTKINRSGCVVFGILTKDMQKPELLITGLDFLSLQLNRLGQIINLFKEQG